MTDNPWNQLAELGMDYLLSQIFAALSLLLVIIGFVQKSDDRLKWLLLLSCVTMAPHFYFLSAWGGFITNFVVLARYVAALRWPGSRIAFAVFVTAGTVLVLWHYRDARDLLVIAANILGCTAVFLNKGMAMRWWFLPTAVCWLSYNALNLSIFGVAFESFCLAANVVGMQRMRRQLAAVTIPSAPQ
jgi:hypothetical protein